MDTPEKPKPQNLAERIAKFWESPSIAGTTKVTNNYLAKALAKANELLARLTPKK